MAEEVTTPKTPPEQPKAPDKPALDASRPLSSQVNTILKLAGDKPKEEPADKKEDKKDDTPPEEKPKEAAQPPAADEYEEDEPEQPEPVKLGPVEKFVLDKLPTLTARIKDGDSVKVVRFKDISELPAGFELADDAARAAFTADVAAQVGRAKDAIAEYQRIDLNNKVRAFEEQEAKEVAADLARLQRQGVIPKFQYKEDDPHFNDDEAVKLANKIYALFRDTNDAYRQAGKTYRITYEDAADKYFAREARTKANDSQKAVEQPKEEKRELTPAQKERQQIAKRTGAPSGGDPKAQRPVVRSGMRLSDINRLVSLGRI